MRSCTHSFPSCCLPRLFSFTFPVRRIEMRFLNPLLSGHLLYVTPNNFNEGIRLSRKSWEYINMDSVLSRSLTRLTHPTNVCLVVACQCHLLTFFLSVCLRHPSVRLTTCFSLEPLNTSVSYCVSMMESAGFPIICVEFAIYVVSCALSWPPVPYVRHTLCGRPVILFSVSSYHFLSLCMDLRLPRAILVTANSC